MTTLKELLDAGDIEGVRVWVYGQERLCPAAPGHNAHKDSLRLCSLCHGTELARGPGLVERCQERALHLAKAQALGPVPVTPGAILAALREELGMR